MNNQTNNIAKSRIFPGLPLCEIIPRSLEQCKVEGRNRTLKAFRRWISEQIRSRNQP